MTTAITGEPLRALYFGKQSAKGTPATSFICLLPDKAVKWNPDHDPEQVNAMASTIVRERSVRPKVVFDKLQISHVDYYDLGSYLWDWTLGGRTTTAASGETVVYDNVFKEAVGNVYATLVFLQGYDWYQANDCVVQKLKHSTGQNKFPTFTIDAESAPVAKISPPTSVAVSIASYIHPSFTQFKVKVNGSDNLLFKDFDVTVDRMRTAEVTGNQSAAPSRWSEAKGVKVAFSGTLDHVGYASSLLANYIAGTQPGSFDFQFKDNATTIGIASKPTIDIVFPNPWISVDPDFDNKSESKIKGVGQYDGTSASAIAVTYRNEIAGTGFAGT